DSSLSIRIFVRIKMSRDVITVGSTMRIPLLYIGFFVKHQDFCSNQDESRRDHGWFNNADSIVIHRQMCGSEYGEQDRKAAILYEYETFKAIEGEHSLDTYLRYLQVINDLKKCGYKKDNCELNYKFLNNLQPE
nr:hypothetical protein [Tanacetum cinerariifolium]